MDTLQLKYNDLLKKQETSKLEQVKIQTNLDTLKQQREELVQELLGVTNTKTYAEALQKITLLTTKLEEKAKEAEELLNASE